MSISHCQQAPQPAPAAADELRTVTAAVLFKDGKLLIARRPAADPLANKWEFPGGKMETGETPEACLARELKEELGIEVEVGSFLGESIHRYQHGSIRLLAFQACWQNGELEPKVHSAIAWASVVELDHYDFAPADVPFVEKLMKGQWIMGEG